MVPETDADPVGDEPAVKLTLADAQTEKDGDAELDAHSEAPLEADVSEVRDMLYVVLTVDVAETDGETESVGETLLDTEMLVLTVDVGELL